MAPIDWGKLIPILIVLLSIPAHALLWAYFLNERMFRKRKYAVLDWLHERGLVSEDFGRRKKF